MMAVDIMHHFKKSLFIAHREELIMQAYEEINNFFPMQVGIVKAERFEIDKKIVVASAQTLHRRLDKMSPDMFEYIAVDEFHHYTSQSFIRPLEHFSPKLQVGWTATPKRLDGVSLTNIAEKIVFQYGIDQGVNDGWLCKLDAYSVRTATNLSGVHRLAGDFNQKELAESVNNPERNKLIYEKYKQYCKNGEQALAFCVDIQHCYDLAQVFLDGGIIAEVIVSDKNLCPNRKELIRDFKKGKIQVLINCEILTEGFNYVDIACLLMCRPTQSESMYIQMIGRGTRLKTLAFQEKYGHNKCIILDFVDNTSKHSIVNAYELEKNKPIEDRIFVSDENKELLLEERRQREMKIKARYEADKKVDLLKLPEIEIWQNQRMLEPATEAQLLWIKRLGVYDKNSVYTKMMASEVISNQPCSQNQVRYLAEHGYDVTGGASIGQFQKVKRSIELKEKFAIKTPKNIYGNYNPF